MFIYSEKIFVFLNDLKIMIKEVLAREVGLRVSRDRFYNQAGTCSYPIQVVIYNNKKMLGYFDCEFYELGFHVGLMHAPRHQLLNIVRHEVAHYLAFIKYGKGILPHATEFKTICREMGWDAEVSCATIALECENEIPASHILRKIEKLMALSTSSNQNEAEQALIKSQQLLLKHNLESKDISGHNEKPFVVKRILKQKRENSKMRAIGQILKTFFVDTVYTRGGDYIYLEILGESVNVEIADYVATVLELELDRLWEHAQREVKLKGVVAKNSFFLGIARGYCNKVKSLMRTHSSDTSQSLMVIEKQLVDMRDRIYQRLTSRKSYSSHCASSAAFGEMMGKQLNINPALKSSAVQSNLLITS